MLAPCEAIRAVIAATPLARSGAPRTTTAARPLRRCALSPVPTLILTLRSRSRPTEVRTARSRSSASPGGEQHGQRQVAADHHLLEVEDLRADVGDGVEEGAGDARPVLTGDGHQQRLRGHVGHRARLSTPISRPGGSLAMRPGRGSARGRTSGPRCPTVNSRVPTAYKASAPAA